jgi:hypothetical protein
MNGPSEPRDIARLVPIRQSLAGRSGASLKERDGGHLRGDRREAAVLGLANRGFRLFPVHAGSKHPMITQWPQQATTEPEQLCEWIQECPDCNWGLAAGPGSGIFVLDVDGELGLATMRELWNQGYELPPTLTATTSRGHHSYFQYPGDASIRNSVGKVGLGLDIRGDGGYVLVPPSVHPSGAVYEWTHDEAAVASAPDWLLERLLARSPSPTTPGSDHNGAIPEGQRNASLASLAGTMRRRNMTAASIVAALLAENEERCTPPLSEAEVRDIGRSVCRYEAESVTAAHSASPVSPQWPDPEPLGGELPPVPAFDVQLLPTSLRPLVEDVTERMRVPLDYPAAVAVLCLAGVTNRRAMIQPKAKDTSWLVVPNLWGGIIAPPSQMKSPVIAALTHPLTLIESGWRSDQEAAQRLYAQQREEADLKTAAWKDQFKASAKNGKAAPPRPIDDSLAPKARRLLTQDGTFEALHTIMAENPGGIFVIRDELTDQLLGRRG